LPKPSVDTGAGLERLAAVLQNVSSNYEIDLFQSLIKNIADITGESDLENTSLRVIADHIRACAFLAVDGVIPANEGRGYVLRRIVRRAVRHGYQLGVKDIFFYKLVASLVEVMGSAYPELVERRGVVEKVLKEEEEQFARTLDNGMVILEKAIKELNSDTIPGQMVFKLYDTYGFPVDLTADVAREHNMNLDLDGFEQAMLIQKNQARAASNFGSVEKLDIGSDLSTDFTGYENLDGTCSVTGIFDVQGDRLDEALIGEELLVLLNASPFYGESGGQVGDHGILDNDTCKFEVFDTQKQGEVLIHRGVMRTGALRVGDQLSAHVAEVDRLAITLNHSATHLMHAALRNILGEHVTQKGSLVDADRLRFDFSHSTPVTEEELKQVEAQVNHEILANSIVEKEVMPISEAKTKGALALFGEKYGDEVRVVTMGGEYSVEFCGGCHVNRTGDIGLFKVASETGISAGVRRIEAVTGKGALTLVENEEQTLKQIMGVVNSGPLELVDRVQQLAANNRTLEKQLGQLKAKMASSVGDELASQVIEINGTQVLVATLEKFNSKSLRDTVDRLKNKLGTTVIVLASINDGKVDLVVGVSKDLTKKVTAGDLANMVAEQIGGKGGGRPDMAMAGGNDVSAVPSALESVKPWLEGKL
ncbi:MAG TPA: alanine--tRNA ligase, partial [Gammaproteobacteria bacterium]|nr:alanine--tRNA ligase [Gammaproteobacteria bacterium]